MENLSITISEIFQVIAGLLMACTVTVFLSKLINNILQKYGVLDIPEKTLRKCKKEMKIIGLVHGIYEGNKWAKVVMSEKNHPDRGVGLNAVVSKIVYELYEEIATDWQLYEGQEVNVFYDRFGRVNRIELSGG